MSLWGSLTNSSQAMITQSHTLAQISTNVTNMNTNGYKQVDTQFKTMLSSASPQSNFFSVKAVDYRRTDQQGYIQSTGRTMDLAINGDGMFIVNNAFDGTGDTFYTRDGGFSARVSGDGSSNYLTTNNGYYVQGWAADEDGNFPTNEDGGGVADGTRPAGPIQINSFDTIAGQATSTVTVGANLDANATTTQNLGVRIYGEAVAAADGTETTPVLNFVLTFEPDGTQDNVWTVGGNITEGGTVTVTPSAIEFDGEGQMTVPADATFAATVTYDDGTTQDVTLDLSDVTQYANSTRIDYIENDGMVEGMLSGTYFDDKGVLYGEYTNGATQALYKLAMADFPAVEKLEMLSNNLYRATEEAGERQVFAVETVLSGRTQIEAGALETSTVELTDQFSKMIATQTAYSTAANVFRTSDEMTQTAAGLKS